MLPQRKSIVWEQVLLAFQTFSNYQRTSLRYQPGCTACFTKNDVIYQFSCHCDSRYVGRTFQRLQDRIKQHVSKSIRSCSSSRKRLLPAHRCKSSIQTNSQSLASDSAIGLHLLQNPTCAQDYVSFFGKAQRFAVFEVSRFATQVDPYPKGSMNIPLNLFLHSYPLKNPVKLPCSGQKRAKREV